MRTSGVRISPARPGARGKLCYRPSGRPRRPWLNRTEHLPTKQEVAGSNPAGRAVSEAEAGDAPGRDPGESGFEPRRTPRPCGHDVPIQLTRQPSFGHTGGEEEPP